MKSKADARMEKIPGKVQRVWDDRGTAYELGVKVAEGGQGIVLTTRADARLLVKVSKWPNTEPKTLDWRRQIEQVHRLPITENKLPIAMPKALIVKPRAGYVMELMDGLMPLEELLKEAQQAFLDGDGLSGYLASGGLRRRLRLLARLARVMARLHGLGIAHGDLSPKNVFVSESHEHAEVWLIDCDNLTYAVRDSSLQLYTPDYGAPELLRGERGISTYTDIWSFAVMAFQLLAVLHPFKSGDLVDQDSELEGAALRGELPWVDHPEDESNRASLGIPRALVCTPVLRDLFDRCFRLGVLDAGERPLMAEWADAFEAAVAVQVLCDAEHGGCGSTFLWSRDLSCPFCDTAQPAGSVLRLVHSVFAAPEDLGDLVDSKNRQIVTGYFQTVAGRPVALRSAPPGTACYAGGELVLSLQIVADDLVIQVEHGRQVYLSLAGSTKLLPLQGRVPLPRRGVGMVLHFGSDDRTHDVWRFKW
jgi:DNA-binding helix-hairpin-helix protein with protein kinase domain